ncbi:MAG: PspA/IM30 family protein [Methanocellales archaeon]
MSLINRISTAIKAKVHKILETFEDPRETLDYSYEKQLELLQKVKRGIAEVVTSKKRLELQKAKLEETVNKLNAQAREAVALGRDDLAKLALERKRQTMEQIDAISAQIAQLDLEEQKLIASERRLSAKVEEFRTRKETIKATYTAAEAQVKITEAVTGISEEMEDIGITIQRAEDKTEKMKARAAALEELVAKGTLVDLTSSRDEVERQLAELRIASDVEKELAILKQEVRK